MAYIFIKNLPPPNNSIIGHKSGVSGGLGFLIIYLMFLNPFFGLGSSNYFFYNSELNSPELIDIIDWQLFKKNVWGIIIIFVGLSIYTGYGLAKGRSKIVVKRAKILLWIIGPTTKIVINMVLPQIYFGVYFMSKPELIGFIGGQILLTTFLTIYLSKSKRVKLTYYHLNTQEEDI